MKIEGVAVKREGRDGVPTIHAMVDGCICCTGIPYEEYTGCMGFVSMESGMEEYPNAVLCDCERCRQMFEAISEITVA